MSPARFRWGILLIQLGIVILLANLDIINFNFFFEGLVFVSVVLILVGIEKIFTKSRLQFISYLTSFAILGAAFVIVYNTSLGGSEGSYWGKTIYRQDFDSSIERVEAVLDFNDIGLTIRDAGDDLLYGRFDEFTAKPNVDYTLADGTALIKMKKRATSFFGDAIHIETDKPRDWYLRFSDQVPIDLECYGEESDIHLNMSTSRLQNLDLNADNAKIYLKLGKLEPRVKVVIQGDDSSLKLRIPEEVGIRISGEDYRSYLEKLGLEEDDTGVFINEGYDTLTTQIEIDLDYRLKSFVLDYF